ELSKLKTNGAHDVPSGRIQFLIEGREGAAEVRSWLPVENSRLAGRWYLACLPNRAHRLGHLGHLLFESPVGRAAVDVGGSLCGVRHLGVLGVASTGHVCGFPPGIFRSGRLVDLDRSLTRSSMAARSRSDAAGDHRR